ncbi:MAG: starch-binding protein [Muribaculaceae bacterium]|nr:starch-binding protein [Muribaculaceae bacterium]
MKRFSTYLKPILPLAAALALPLTQGCSDDLFRNGEGDGNSERGVVVYVPKVQPGQQLGGSGRTRGALNAYKANEGDINSLHLFAYPAAGGAAQVFDLLGGDVKPSASAPEDYEGYVLDLTPGDYRLYVVANVDFTDAASLTEKSLKDYEVKVPESAKEGLPMSCSNSGMTVSYNGAATYSTVGEQGVNVAGGATVKVKADLKFAVAKVRVTMLNDLRPDLELESASLGSMADISSLMTDGSVTATIGTADFMEASYYTLPEMQPDLLDVDVENMDIQAVRPDDGWAWQGTAYVAERLFDADEANPSTVNLTLSDGTEKVLTVGTKGEGLKRSYFYDYVGNSKGEFVVEVQPWDAITIAGALHGPYYLHVDETSLSIEAGQSTSIWYESNAPIECVSGTYTNATGEEVSIYDFTISDNEISVSVSPQIKGSELDAVKEQDGWKSFVIKAGTIEKRIEIKELDLHEFLTVDVNSVTIDVREQVASGYYSGSFVIPVRTNLEQFSIDWNWEGLGVGELVTLCDPEGEPFSDTLPITPGQGGVYNLQVSFTGLNDGEDFWQSSRQLQFTVSGTLANGTTVSETVNVNIVASTEDYIIHLYAPGWSTPHIYVYQCLELPSTHKEHPNAPVGVDKNDAALEYSFTGAVAFRGWNVPYTDENGNQTNYNDPTASLEKQDNFYVFNGSPSQYDWKPGQDNWTHHYYDLDFCAEYRKTVDCNSCKTGNIDRDWPGIKMESEGGDWWVFKLSGIATPGKALIMFTDADNGHNSRNRYPADNAPGIPLFDYPSREGYFSVEDGSTYEFTATKPVSETYRYRIYWPYNSSNWNGLNIWNGSFTVGNEGYNNFGSTQTTTNGTYGKYNDQYAYVEFERTARSTIEFNYQRMPNNDKDSKIPNNYKEVDGYYCYTITGEGTGYAGQPTGGVIDPPTPSDNITIYLYNEANWSQVNLNYWGGTGVTGEGYPGPVMQSAPEKGANWYKYSVPANTENVEFTSNGNNNAKMEKFQSQRPAGMTEWLFTNKDNKATYYTGGGSSSDDEYITIYFKNNFNWNNLTIHYWYNENGSNTAITDWNNPPSLTSGSNDWYKYTMTTDKAVSGFLIREGTGTQTQDYSSLQNDVQSHGKVLQYQFRYSDGKNYIEYIGSGVPSNF